MADTTEKLPTKEDQDQQHPLLNLRDEIDRVFDRFSAGWPQVSNLFHRGSRAQPFEDWPSVFKPGTAPTVDVAESSKAYEITAELPGLDEKDIDVTVANGRLTLKAEKKAEREQEEKDFYLKERRYGTFQRSFIVPPDVDEKKLSATYRKGVLTVKLPKSANAKTRAKKIRVMGE